MSASQRKENLLSAWKEIATYLDCSERTCRRWEKKYGLPVYRIHEESKSRIYTYKEELDRWLEEGSIHKYTAQNSLSKKFNYRKSLYFLIPAVCIAAFIVVYFSILKAPKPPKYPQWTGVPQSSGPLTLEDKDIITTEFAAAGKLRVWRKEKAKSYKEVWNIWPVRHSSIAIGSVDNESDCEIAGAGVCRESEERGERRISYYRYFINVYKQGVRDWWKTTYYSEEDCVYEDKRFDLNEIAMANVDGEPGDEIVLATMTCLSVFKYYPEKDELKLFRSRYSFLEDVTLFLKSVTVADIDNDNKEEILIAADEQTDQGLVENKGWILILKVQDDELIIIQSIQVNANLAFQSLRMGDVIPGGKKEIISSAYRKSSGMWNSYIMGWDEEGRKKIEKQVYYKGDYQQKEIHLDMGNLIQGAGEEILIGHHNPDELIYYGWDGKNLAELSRFPLDFRVAVTNVFVIDSESSSDSSSEVIVCGTWEFGDEGHFYLELLGFEQDLYSKWRYLGGKKGDMRVSYAAVGKKHKREK
jgi:hypothetical protein